VSIPVIFLYPPPRGVNDPPPVERRHPRLSVFFLKMIFNVNVGFTHVAAPPKHLYIPTLPKFKFLEITLVYTTQWLPSVFTYVYASVLMYSVLICFGSTSIYSLVYSHTHGCHAHCTWWHNVNVIEGAELGTNFFTFFCYDLSISISSLQISTKKIWNVFTGRYLNQVLHWNLTQFLIFENVPSTGWS